MRLDTLIKFVTLAAAGTLIAIAGNILLTTVWTTGPGCPLDPTWLGFCGDIRR